MKKLMIVAAVALGMVVETRSESAAWQNETEMTKEWPVGIGIVVPAQFPPVRHDVCGFRFGGLLGWNETVRGLDLGLGNVATDNEYGLQLGGVNAVWGDFAGLQAGCFNYNASISAGAQFGVLNWDSLAAYGFLLGAVNTNLRSLDGIAFGGVNFAGTVVGSQLGVINLADDITGCQIGVVNACERMHGVQLGVINLINTSKLPCMVLLNAWF